jgi:hypothetical protein
VSGTSSREGPIFPRRHRILLLLLWLDRTQRLLTVRALIVRPRLAAFPTQRHPHGPTALGAFASHAVRVGKNNARGIRWEYGERAPPVARSYRGDSRKPLSGSLPSAGDGNRRAGRAPASADYSPPGSPAQRARSLSMRRSSPSSCRASLRRWKCPTSPAGDASSRSRGSPSSSSSRPAPA